MLGALAAGVVQGGASLLGGLFGASKQRDRDKANVKAMDLANAINNMRAESLNDQLRRRADAAAKVPVVTTTKDSSTTSTDYGKWELSTSDVDLDAFLDASARSGINPLTMIRSGAMGLFGRAFSQTGGRDTTTSSSFSETSTTGERAMEAALAGNNIAYYQPNQLLGAPPQSGGQAFAGALSDGLGAFTNWHQNSQQNALMTRQLDQQARAVGNALQGARRSTMGSLAGGSVGGRQIPGGGQLRASATPGPADDALFAPFKAAGGRDGTVVDVPWLGQVHIPWTEETAKGLDWMGELKDFAIGVGAVPETIWQRGAAHRRRSEAEAEVIRGMWGSNLDATKGRYGKNYQGNPVFQ